MLKVCHVNLFLGSNENRAWPPVFTYSGSEIASAFPKRQDAGCNFISGFGFKPGTGLPASFTIARILVTAHGNAAAFENFFGCRCDELRGGAVLVGWQSR
jgi:hypothetical protein